MTVVLRNEEILTLGFMGCLASRGFWASVVLVVRVELYLEGIKTENQTSQSLFMLTLGAAAYPAMGSVYDPSSTPLIYQRRQLAFAVRIAAFWNKHLFDSRKMVISL